MALVANRASLAAAQFAQTIVRQQFAANGAGLESQPTTVNEKPPGPPPLALAMEWVAKITTVAVEMFLPALGGAYLDRRLGTRYWTLMGVVLGFVVGIWHLLQMTRNVNRRSGKPKGEGTANGPQDG